MVLEVKKKPNSEYPNNKIWRNVAREKVVSFSKMNSLVGSITE